MFRAGSLRTAWLPEGLATGLFLAALLVLAWAVLFRTASGAESYLCRADTAALPALLGMWVVMMIAMMTPSASPMILSYARAVARHDRSPGRLGLVAAFAGIYFAVWAAFGILGAMAEWALAEAGIGGDGKLSDPLFAGALIVIAGLYQWSAVKAECLARCHAPLAFSHGRFRPGLRGAVTLGINHSIACLGCCWLLMLLAFVGGSMHLGWMLALTLFVAMEKVFGARTASLRLSALVLLSAGTAYMLTSPLLHP